MKISKIVGLTFCLGAMSLQAQQTNDVEQLRTQLLEMQSQFEKVQLEQRQQIDALTKKLDELLRPSETIAAKPAEQKKLEQDLANELQTDFATTTAAAPGAVAKPGKLSDPIRLAGGGSSFLNLSLDGLFAAGGSTADDIENLQLGGHDPNQRGFTIQNVEMVLDGIVDPYFRGQANLVYQLNAEGESVVELEEAYLQSLSLPGNLQLKAGQFFTEFGRHNPTHPHAWTFVDQPLVNGRFLGPDGLRNPGARISWLLPTPFYSELFLTMQNSQGETATSFRNENGGEPFLGRINGNHRVKSFDDFIFTPRLASSFELTDEQTLLLGASGAFGPNASGAKTDTQIYGLDFFWKWKPVDAHAGFPFVSWQTEAMARRYQAGAFTGDLDGDGIDEILPSETLFDYGAYSQLAYGFKKGWVAALRGEFVERREQAEYEKILGDDPTRLGRWRISPNLTWYPSEFSKIRMQYNYDRRQKIGDDHSVWLQWEFMIGAHSAHKF